MPTLGTAAIIAAGFVTTSAGASRVLTLGPVRHVGRISYSWYLWHWPPLVFAAAIWGSLSPLEGIAVLAVSYIPAVVTNRLIEKPFLHSESLTRFPRKALALGGACTATSAVLGLGLFVLTPTIPEAPERGCWRRRPAARRIAAEERRDRPTHAEGGRVEGEPAADVRRRLPPHIP